MKPVDGGRAVIGIIECPNCGQTHYTTQIECGFRKVFCGTGNVDNFGVGQDGYSELVILQII